MTKLEVKAIFEDCRTCNEFSSKEVPDELLQKAYDLMKFGPTSGNCSPLRILFVKSSEAKEKLLSSLMQGNLEKTKTAPVVAILAMDEKFYEKLPFLFPHNPAFAKMFENNQELSYETAFRNSSLQAAYFIMICRYLGLDCGPMSGFDAEKINKDFFLNSNYKVNFICNLGYKASDPTYPRLPKLAFDEVCKFV